MDRIISKNENETIRAGEQFSQRLKNGHVVALFGDLGSGKTRFAKGISLGLGVKENVTSPTFTIVNEHLDGRIPLYHFDFYRLRTLSELDEIGFDEYVFGEGVCIFEWADMIREKLPQNRIDVFLSMGINESERIIRIEER